MSTEQNNGKPAVPPKRNLLNDRRIRLLLSLLGAVIAWRRLHHRQPVGQRLCRLPRLVQRPRQRRKEPAPSGAEPEHPAHRGVRLHRRRQHRGRGVRCGGRKDLAHPGDDELPEDSRRLYPLRHRHLEGDGDALRTQHRAERGGDLHRRGDLQRRADQPRHSGRRRGEI